MNVRIPSVFVSHASKDESFAATLETHLAPLVQSEEIKLHSHRTIVAGQDMHAEVEAHLGAADIVLLLLSPDYLEVCGGSHAEMTTALLRRAATGVAVIPVLVRSCIVEASPIGQLRSMPENGKPISTWTDPDTAWSAIAVEVRKRAAERAKRHRGPITSVLPRADHVLGRDALSNDVVAALVADPPRPVMLLGGPGIGKTTLSKAVLHRPEVVRLFGTRRVFARLEGARSADEALSVIAAGAGASPPADMRTAMLAWLAEAPTLLVLDNLETPHSSDRVGIEELLAWLNDVPGVSLLASARGTARPTSVAWKVVEVKRLEPPHDAELFGRVAGFEAAHEVVTALVAQLGGVPLAIELLAHAACNDLVNLRNEWDTQRTAMLSNGGTDKQSSWAACVEVSFGSPRMTSEAERLARVAALLPDGVAAEDLPHLIAGGPAAARVLAQVGIAYFEAGRLRMLPPLREHVATTRAPESADLQRVAEHYRALVATLGPIAGWRAGRGANARLRAEWGNIDAILRWGLGTAAQAPWIDAATALCDFMRYSGLGTPDVIRVALRAAENGGDTPRVAACNFTLADIALDRSAYHDALVGFETALALYRDVGSVLGEARCIDRLGDCALRQSKHAEARARYEVALPLYRQVGRTLGEGNCMLSLGDIAYYRSDLDEARAHYNEALSLYRRADDELGEAMCFRRLGDIALQQADHSGARTRYEAALGLFREVGGIAGEAMCILRLGDVALEALEHSEARRGYEAALPLFRRAGDVQGEAECIRGLGDVARAAERNEEARVRYEEALTLFTRLPEPRSMGETHQRLALVALTEDARRLHVQAAQVLWAQIDRPDLVAELQSQFEE